nr:N-acetylmuramoyl-L-alanine amidase [Planomonospora venezuelensis]
MCGLAAAACGGSPEDVGAGPDRTAGPGTGPAATAAESSPGAGESPAPGAAEGSPGTTTPAGPSTATASGTASGTAEAPAPGGEAAGAKPLQGKVVVIDPGHNERNHRHTAEINRQVDVLTQKKACDTTGTATASGYSEAAFAWDVSLRMKRILEARGAQVRLTRSADTPYGPCITERAAIGNRPPRADAAISVHADGSATGNHGFHVIMPKKISSQTSRMVAESEKLGRAVRDSFRRGTGLPYSTYIGDRALNFRNDLGGLNLSTVPKVFIECGNMKNPAEAAKFQDAGFRKRIATALANGIQSYLR